jgi:putative polyketide hydroxylase
MTEKTNIVIVGGGLAGLSSAMFLAAQGTPFILVDKYPGSSPHPKAIGYTQRTMQFVKALGLGDKIPEIADGFRLRRARVQSLAGDVLEEFPWNPEQEPEDMSAFSPVRGAAIAQDSLEPIFRDKAVSLGADIRLSTEMTGFEQDAEGVTVKLRERDTGKVYEVRTDYLIAADGAASPIREALGIARTGIGHVRTMFSILFRPKPDLEKYLDRGISQFVVDQGEFQAFLTTYRDGRWVLYYWGEEVNDPAIQETMIRRAVGLDDIRIEIINSGSWELAGLINDTYAQGRIFIMGDAAHTLPPTRGGWGANTGIDDANNLAWKLSSVVSGKSSPALLNTYNAERQPIGTLRHDQTFSRPDYQRPAGDKAAYLKDTKLLGDSAMELGQLYRSAAIIGAGDDLPPAARPDEWLGQPGTLAPHVWVKADAKRTSTMYLYFNRWTLLATTSDWQAAAAQAAERLDIPVDVLVIGSDVVSDEDRDIAATYGLTFGGASLIRPDGYVAWRSVGRPAEPTTELISALGLVASAVKSA